MKIVIDTETTGVTRLGFANKLNYRQWPRMVQIAWALLKNDSIAERRTYLIQPVDYIIPPRSTQIHGISQEQALAEGSQIQEVLKKLQKDLTQADAVIAHNINFDLGVIESEALRHQLPITVPETRICTLNLGRKYLKKERGIERGGRTQLGQLYETLFGFGYGPRHNADNDVTACFHVYRRLKQLGFA